MHTHQYNHTKHATHNVRGSISTNIIKSQYSSRFYDNFFYEIRSVRIADELSFASASVSL